MHINVEIILVIVTRKRRCMFCNKIICKVIGNIADKTDTKNMGIIVLLKNKKIE
jgi:hypothetical protein